MLNNYIKIVQYIGELQPGHESKHTKTETASVNLTFEIGAWFFLATHRIFLVDTSGKDVAVLK